LTYPAEFGITKLYDQKQKIRHTSHIAKVNWIIVGGESGPGARPIMQEWVTDIRDQCLGAKVPFFFKQWGGVQKKRAGRTLEGRTWYEMPRNLVRA
jgi:protein gp37